MLRHTTMAVRARMRCLHRARDTTSMLLLHHAAPARRTHPSLRSTFAAARSTLAASSTVSGSGTATKAKHAAAVKQADGRRKASSTTEASSTGAAPATAAPEASSSSSSASNSIMSGAITGSLAAKRGKQTPQRAASSHQHRGRTVNTHAPLCRFIVCVQTLWLTGCRLPLATVHWLDERGMTTVWTRPCSSERLTSCALT